jgi:hypothetical protein
MKEMKADSKGKPVVAKEDKAADKPCCDECGKKGMMSSGEACDKKGMMGNDNKDMTGNAGSDKKSMDTSSNAKSLDVERQSP